MTRAKGRGFNPLSHPGAPQVLTLKLYLAIQEIEAAYIKIYKTERGLLFEKQDLCFSYYNRTSFPQKLSLGFKATVKACVIAE